MKQVLVPFLIGVLVLIPPQLYVWLNGLNGISIGFTQLLTHYLTLSPLELADGQKVTLFAFGHLWYLVYLWCYTVILTLAVAFSGRFVPAAAAWLGRQLAGPRLLIIPVLFFLIVRATLRPAFPSSLNLVNDWYSHAIYLSAFVAGVVLANHQGFWADVVRYRRVALSLSLAFACLMLVRRYALPEDGLGLWDFPFGNLVISMFRWYSIAAILGYARCYWTRDYPALRYFNKAVLTYYMLHQTVTVLLAYWLNSMHLLTPEAFVPMVIGTFLICAVIYEGIRKLRRLVILPRPLPA